MAYHAPFSKRLIICNKTLDILEEVWLANEFLWKCVACLNKKKRHYLLLLHSVTPLGRYLTYRWLRYVFSLWGLTWEFCELQITGGWEQCLGQVMPHAGPVLTVFNRHLLLSAFWGRHWISTASLFDQVWPLFWDVLIFVYFLCFMFILCFLIVSIHFRY